MIRLLLWASAIAAGFAMVYSFITDSTFWSTDRDAGRYFDVSAGLGIAGMLWLITGLFIAALFTLFGKKRKIPPPTWEQTTTLAHEYDLRMPHTYYEDIAAGKAEEKSTATPERLQLHYFDEWQPHPELGIDVRVCLSDPLGAVQVRRSKHKQSYKACEAEGRCWVCGKDLAQPFVCPFYDTTLNRTDQRLCPYHERI